MAKEAKEKNVQSEKDRAIEQAISAIEKQFGKGSIMRLGSVEQISIPTISSGSIGLDLALGIGGFPRGRVIEIYGPEASGKTTVALHAVAECQKSGGVAAFIDAEHALDVQYAKRMGVDIENLLICQPDCGEQALEIADMLVRSNSVDIIVIDSVAALVPRAELEGDMGDAHVGLQARLMSQALRKLTASADKSKTALVFINQLRTKVGIMFGNPETTPGGQALKFYSSVRLDVRKVSLIKNGQDVVGQRTRIKIVKNKMAPPFREVEVDIIYGQGINREGDLLDLGAALNVVDKSGAWYSFEGERLGNGREACKDFLAANPAIRTAIENRIREAKNLPMLDEFLSAHHADEDTDSEASEEA
ncbi:MAG: recombinase RecA [Proteobacteria bacterium]|nr:recombinase RecA [Pseudomonadota bacterium]